jgi:spore coat protein CotH
VNSRDWYWLLERFQTNDYYPANMKWNGQTVANVAIRSRGTGSRSGTKPALRVDFNRYATGRTFLGLTAIDLNNDGP